MATRTKGIGNSNGLEIQQSALVVYVLKMVMLILIVGQIKIKLKL